MIKCLQRLEKMIGKKIKYYRLKNGLTCEELAKKLVSQKQLFRYMKMVSVNLMMKIAKKYPMHWVYLGFNCFLEIIPT